MARGPMQLHRLKAGPAYPVHAHLWWCCVKCVIHHERDMREEQHDNIRGANKH